MVIGCGSLSQVNDDRHLAKLVRTPRQGGGGGGGSAIKQRWRKSRLKSRFKNAFCRDDPDADPLDLVGSEFLVREYPLAVLEGGRSKSGGRGGGKPSASCRSPQRRRKHNEMRDDEQEERLLQLQRIVYENTDCSLSEGTIASVRRRGLDGVLSSSSSSSSSVSSSITRQSIQNISSHHAQRVRRKALRKIHGRSRGPAPSCPNCSGRLTYLYLSTSRDRGRVNVCEILAGRDSTREKMENLLPPLCEKCGTHLLFEHSKCKELLMKNFETWVESGFDGGDSESEEDGRRDGAGGCRKFNDPLNAKIIVVDDDAPENDSSEQMTIDVAASGMMEHPTPRRSNSSSSRAERREGFKFDDDAMENPVFSGISELSDRTYRRKGELRNEDTNNNGDVQPQNMNRQEEGSTVPANGEMPMDGDLPDNESKIDYFSSDEDPFSELLYEGDEDDEMTMVEPKDTNGNIRGDGRGGENAEIPPETPLLTKSLSANTSLQSIKVIRTESEERAILERYSMKKEVATRQIAKNLIRGRELTASECERCQMPLMRRHGDAALDCVACPAIQRKAKQRAKQKRKSMGSPRCDEQRRDLSLEEVAKNGGAIFDAAILDATTERENNVDERSAHSPTYDLIYAAMGKKDDSEDAAIFDATREKADDIDEGSVHSLTYDLIYAAMGKKDDTEETSQTCHLNKDSVSLAILEETRHLNALEEGQLGCDSSDKSNPLQFLGIMVHEFGGDCSEGINYGSYGGANNARRSAADAPARWHPPSSSSSVYLNPPNEKRQTEAGLSITCSRSDYWVRHSSSQSSSMQPSAASSSCSYASSAQQYPAVEYSLSCYQENVRQRQRQPDATAEAGERQHYRSFSNQYLGSISEVSEHRQQCDHRHGSRRRGGSLVEMPEHHVSSSQYPSSETMFQKNPPHMVAEERHYVNYSHGNQLQFQCSSSEVPEYENSSSSETSQRQYQPSVMLDCQSSMASANRCPRNLPPSEMLFQMSQPNIKTEKELRLHHGLNGQNGDSISEVSAREGSFEEPIRCPSSEVTHSQYNPNRKTDPDQLYDDLSGNCERSSSTVSETRCPTSLFSSEMMIQNEGSISEVILLRGTSGGSIRCHPSEPTRHQHQPYATSEAKEVCHSHGNQFEGSSSEVSDTRCPLNFPPSETMIWNNQPNIRTGRGQDEQRGGSEVSAQGGSPKESIRCPLTKNVTIDSENYHHSHSDHYEVSSTASSTLCSHNLHSSEMIQHQCHPEWMTEINLQVGDGQTSHHGITLSEVTISRGDSAASSTRCPRDLAPSGMIYCQPQSNMTNATEKQHQGSSTKASVRKESSDQSPTRCPRNVPSEEMIWHYKSLSCGSPPNQVFPVQSAASDHSHLDQTCGAKVKESETKETGIHSQRTLPEHTLQSRDQADNRRYQALDVKRTLPEQTLQSIRSSDSNQRDNQGDNWRGRALNMNHCGPQKMLSGIDSEGFEELEVAEESRKDNEEKYAEIHPKHGDGIGLEDETSQTLSHSKVAGRHADDQVHGDQEVQGNYSAFASETIHAQVSVTCTDNLTDKKTSSLPAPAPVADEEKLDERLESNSLQDTDEESLSDRIARLADSLREVADRLPLKNGGGIETGCENMPRNKCLYERRQEQPPSNPRYLVSPSVNEISKKNDIPEAEDDQNDVSQMNSVYSFPQTKKELPSEGKSKLGESLEGGGRNRVPSKDDKDSLAREVLECPLPSASNLSITCLNPHSEEGNEADRTKQANQNDGYQNKPMHHFQQIKKLTSEDEGKLSESYLDNVRDHLPIKEKKEIECQAPPESRLSTTCPSPNLEDLTDTNRVFEITQTPANNDYQISERNETAEASEEKDQLRANNLDSLHRSKTLFPVSPYEHNHTPMREFSLSEKLSSVATTSGFQRPLSLWKHESYRPSPMNSVHSSNSFGIQLSPITVRRDEKQFDRESQIHPTSKGTNAYSNQNMELHLYTHPGRHKHRSDPPGHIMKPSDSEKKDPPGTPFGSNSMHTNVTNSKGQITSPIMKASHHDGDEVVAPKGTDVRAKQSSVTCSVSNSFTPKPKGRHLCDNDNIDIDDNLNKQCPQALGEETEQEQQRTVALRKEWQQQTEQPHIQEEQIQLLEEREHEQHRLRALREERERQQRIVQEETSRIREEQQRLRDESEEETRLLQQEGEREQQRLQALREERNQEERERKQREQQQRIAQEEEIRRIQEEQRRLRVQREEEKRQLSQLQEEGEREQQRLQVLREEREREEREWQQRVRQQRISLEETHRIQEEQQRLREQREEEKRLLQEENEREQQRLQALREEREREERKWEQRIAQEKTRRIQEDQQRLEDKREVEKRLLQEERGHEQKRYQYLCEEREQQQRFPHNDPCRLREEKRRLQEERMWGQQRLHCESLIDKSKARTPIGHMKQYTATSPSTGTHSLASMNNNIESQSVRKDEIETRDLPQTKHFQEETVRLNAPSWDTGGIDATLQTAKSWGESSLNELFKQIDEIEDDFHTIVASLPGSGAQTIASSIKSSRSCENESPKSSSEHKDSLVGMTLNNAGSFESIASGDSMVTDVMQRMRRIKDYIEQIDLVDEGSDGSVGSYDSQGEMSQLILRLTNAAAELRTFHEWDD